MPQDGSLTIEDLDRAMKELSGRIDAVSEDLTVEQLDKAMADPPLDPEAVDVKVYESTAGMPGQMVDTRDPALQERYDEERNQLVTDRSIKKFNDAVAEKAKDITRADIRRGRAKLEALEYPVADRWSDKRVALWMAEEALFPQGVMKEPEPIRGGAAFRIEAGRALSFAVPPVGTKLGEWKERQERMGETAGPYALAGQVAGSVIPSLAMIFVPVGGMAAITAQFAGGSAGQHLDEGGSVVGAITVGIAEGGSEYLGAVVDIKILKGSIFGGPIMDGVRRALRRGGTDSVRKTLTATISGGLKFAVTEVGEEMVPAMVDLIVAVAEGEMTAIEAVEQFFEQLPELATVAGLAGFLVGGFGTAVHRASKQRQGDRGTDPDSEPGRKEATPRQPQRPDFDITGIDAEIQPAIDAIERGDMVSFVAWADVERATANAQERNKRMIEADQAKTAAERAETEKQEDLSAELQEVESRSRTKMRRQAFEEALTPAALKKLGEDMGKRGETLPPGLWPLDDKKARAFADGYADGIEAAAEVSDDGEAAGPALDPPLARSAAPVVEPFEVQAIKTDKTTADSRWLSEDVARGQEGSETETVRFERPLRAKNWQTARAAMNLPTKATMSDLIAAARARGHDGIVFEDTPRGREIIDLRFPLDQPSTLPRTAAGVESAAGRVAWAVVPVGITPRGDGGVRTPARPRIEPTPDTGDAGTPAPTTTGEKPTGEAAEVVPVEETSGDVTPAQAPAVQHPDRMVSKSGRKLPGFPDNAGKSRGSMARQARKADEWLIKQAAIEASLDGNDLARGKFNAELPIPKGGLPVASRESATEYLFGRENVTLDRELKDGVQKETSGQGQQEQEVIEAEGQADRTESVEPAEVDRAGDDIEIPEQLDDQDDLKAASLEEVRGLSGAVLADQELVSNAKPGTPKRRNLESRLKATRRDLADKIAEIERVPGAVAAEEARAIAFSKPVRGSAFPDTGKPRAPMAYGNDTKIRLPDGKTLTARYAVYDIDDIVPSHDPRNNYRPNNEADWNERVYEDARQSRDSRATVEAIARDIDPELLLSNNPTAVDGPPIINTTRQVVGGNARTMGLMLHYSLVDQSAYVTELEARAEQFGIDPELLKIIEQPILVRELVETTPSKRGELSSVLNEAMTAAKTADTSAVSRGVMIDTAAAERIAEIMGDGTLSQAMNNPKAVEGLIDVLTSSGAFTAKDWDAYTENRGSGYGLNAEGRAAVERALLGAAIGDAAVLGMASPAARDKVLRSVASISVVKGFAPELDIQARLRNAFETLGLLAEMSSSASNIDHLIEQSAFIPAPFLNDPRGVALAQALHDPKVTPTIFADRMRSLAEVAREEGQMTLGGEVRSAMAEFDVLFPNAESVGTVNEQLDMQVGDERGAYEDEEKYNQPVPEVLAINPKNISALNPEIEATSVSETVARSMDFSEPIKVSIFADGDLRVTDGNHRLSAAKQTGRTSIPVILKAINAKGRDINRLIAEQRTLGIASDSDPNQQQVFTQGGHLFRKGVGHAQPLLPWELNIGHAGAKGYPDGTVELRQKILERFKEKGAGHDHFARSLSRMVRMDAMSEWDESIILKLLEDASDEMLLNLEMKFIHGVSSVAGSFGPLAGFGGPTSARMSGGGTIMMPVQRNDKIKSGVRGQYANPIGNFMHEWGHYWAIMAASAEDKATILKVFKSMSATAREAWFVRAGYTPVEAKYFGNTMQMIPGASGFAYPGLMDRYGDSPENMTELLSIEFFPQAFAEWAQGRAMADPELEPLFKRLMLKVVEWLKDLVRIRGGDPIVKRLEPLFEKAIRGEFDQSLWDEAAGTWAESMQQTDPITASGERGRLRKLESRRESFRLRDQLYMQAEQSRVVARLVGRWVRLVDQVSGEIQHSGRWEVDELRDAEKIARSINAQRRKTQKDQETQADLFGDPGAKPSLLADEPRLAGEDDADYTIRKRHRGAEEDTAFLFMQLPPPGPRRVLLYQLGEDMKKAVTRDIEAIAHIPQSTSSAVESVGKFFMRADKRVARLASVIELEGKAMLAAAITQEGLASEAARRGLEMEGTEARHEAALAQRHQRSAERYRSRAQRRFEGQRVLERFSKQLGGGTASQPGYARQTQMNENRDMAAFHKIIRGLSRSDRKDLGWLGMGRKGESEVSKRVRTANAAMLELMDNGESGMYTASNLGYKRRMPDGAWADLVGSGAWMPQSLTHEGQKEIREEMRLGGGLSPKVEAWADELVAEGVYKNRDNAIQELLQFLDDSIRPQNSYFGRTRTLLPERLVEMDPSKVIPRQLEKNARTVAAGQVFGGYDESNELVELHGIRAVLDEFLTHEQERAAWHQYLDIEFQVSKPIDDTTIRRVVGALMQIQGALKLSGLFTAWLDVGQPLINTAGIGGMGRLAAYTIDYPPAIGRLLGRRAESEAMDAGAVFTRHASTDVLQKSGWSLIDMAASAAMMLKRSSERASYIRAFAIGKRGAEWNLSKLRDLEGENGAIRKIWATMTTLSLDNRATIERRMKRLGIDQEQLADIMASGRKLSDDELRLAGWLLTHDTQFPMTVANKPLYYERNPAIRLTTQFKMFTIRQTGLVWEHGIKEAARGNPAQLVSMMLAALVFGELLQTLRDYLTGSDRAISTLLRRQDKVAARQLARRALAHIARGGMLGALADVNHGIADLILGPTFGTVQRGFESLASFAARPDLDQLGMEVGRFLGSEASGGRQWRQIAKNLSASGRLSRQAYEIRTIAYKWRDEKTDQNPISGYLHEVAEGWGRGYAPKRHTLALRYMGGAVDSGDIDGAAEYLTELLRITPKGERDDLMSRVKSSRSSRSPMGPVSKSDRRAWLDQLPDDQRMTFIEREMRWIDDFNAAVRKSIEAVR